MLICMDISDGAEYSALIRGQLEKFELQWLHPPGGKNKREVYQR